MHLWVCTDHDCHWPVGCASIVLAEDEQMARVLLDAALVQHGLKPNNYTLTEVPLDQARAVVLNDGEY
jgi:ABC-type nitrate/sulfonate/bicarbonate transport system substrate-binding protein